jgi:hypothetical protein
MRSHVTSLTLVVLIALAGTKIAGAATHSTIPGGKKISDTEAPNLRTAPATLTASDAAERTRIFPVMDEKGLLLSCVAPEIDKNTDTDLFNNCSLAPGRSLDEVMHAFISAIHYEQKQRVKERTEWEKELGEKAGQKEASK